MAACSACGAAILWVKHGTTFRRMPLDAAPVDAGHGRFAVVSGRAHAYTETDERLKRDRYVSHFSTCPAADSFRGKGRDQ